MTVFSGLVSPGFLRVLRRFRWLLLPERLGIFMLMVGLSLKPIALPRFVGRGYGDTVFEPGEWLGVRRNVAVGVPLIAGVGPTRSRGGQSGA